MPPINRLYTELRGRGLEVLLVSFRESPETVARAVRERGYVAPVLVDPSGEVTGKAYGVWGPPTAYLVDRQGRLIGRAAGPQPRGEPFARQFLLVLLGARPLP